MCGAAGTPTLSHWDGDGRHYRLCKHEFELCLLNSNGKHLVRVEHMHAPVTETRSTLTLKKSRVR